MGGAKLRVAGITELRNHGSICNRKRFIIQNNDNMDRYIWLSYDLGIQGDYAHMYAWLDNYGAKDCGDSFAYLKYPMPKEMNDEELVAYIKKDLENNIEFKPGNRVYLIRYNPDKKSSTGTFLIGKRKAAPWEGYGDKDSDSSDDSSE